MIKNKEFNWFIAHSDVESQYNGEYIAIANETVVAHGKDFKKVLAESKKHGGNPYIHKVPSQERELIV